MNGDITLGESWNGAIEIDGDLGGLVTVAGDAGYPWSLTANNITEYGGVDVTGDFHGSIPRLADSHEWQGSFQVGGAFGSGALFSRGVLSNTGWIEIAGDADGALTIGRVDTYATIEIGGGLDGTLDVDDLRGTVTVADDLSGILYCDGDLSGTVDVGSMSGLVLVAYGLQRGL